VELLLFADGSAAEPQRVIELDGQHRSNDHWHVEVEGVGIGCCYAYRVFGPLLPGGHGFNPSKVLLDPCARAIGGWDVYQRGAAVGAAPNTHCCLKGVVTERDPFEFSTAPSLAAQRDLRDARGRLHPGAGLPGGLGAAGHAAGPD
jgi:glycogen operon protein